MCAFVSSSLIGSRIIKGPPLRDKITKANQPMIGEDITLVVPGTGRDKAGAANLYLEGSHGFTPVAWQHNGSMDVW